MKCKICGHNTLKIFEGKILNKYNTDYFYCGECEHIQTEEPYWLNEAYSNAIAAQDTGIMKRNLDNSIKTGAVIFNFYDKFGNFLDFGGGYGVLTRLLRDAGFNYFWADKYAENLFAKGFEYDKKNKTELMTAYECFEHFVNPVQEIEAMFKISPDILFSQMTYNIPPPKINSWWYYAPEAGQHISFYSNKTLNYIAQIFSKKHLSANNYHLFTEKDIKEEDFIYTIQNDAQVYAKNMGTMKSKIEDDMYYIINKKPNE